jgi:hypothetical protein
MHTGVAVPKELQSLTFKAILVEVTDDVCIG